jgi:hypothetical protein
LPPRAAASWRLMLRSSRCSASVVVFVYQHVIIGACDGMPVGGVSGHRLGDEWHHVGEINGAGLAKRVLVDAEIFDGLSQRLVIGVDAGRKSLGVEQSSLVPSIMSRMSASSFQYMRWLKNTRRCSGASQSWNWLGRPTIAGLRFRRRNANG